MPKIPVLNNPTIQAQPLGGGELRLNVTPELVGGAKVRNLAALSGTLGEAAVFMDVQRQRRDGQSTMKFKKTLTQVEDQILETNGSLKGEKAFGFNSSIQGLAKTWFQPSEETSGSDEDVVADSEMLEKFGFDSATEQIRALKRIWHQMPSYLREELAPGLKRRFSKLYEKLGRHEQIQNDRALIQDHQQDMQTSLERIRKNPLDGDFIEEQIEMMGLSVDHFANLVGWSEERQNREWQHVLGTVNLTVIDRLLKTGHAEKAREYFAAHRKEFGERDTTALEARIEQQYEVEAGEALANEIFSLPKDLQGRELRDEPNPNIRKAAQRSLALRDRKETLIKMETDYSNKVFIRKLIDQGESPVDLSEITKLDQWLGLDFQTQKRMIQRWEDRAGHRFGGDPSQEGELQFVEGSGETSDLALGSTGQKSLEETVVDLNLKKSWVNSLEDLVSLDQFALKRFSNKDFEVDGYGHFSPEVTTYFSRLHQAARNVYEAEKRQGSEETPNIDELRANLQREKDEVSNVLQLANNKMFDPQFHDFIVLGTVVEIMKEEKKLGRRLEPDEIPGLVRKTFSRDREIQWKKSLKKNKKSFTGAVKPSASSPGSFGSTSIGNERVRHFNRDFKTQAKNLGIGFDEKKMGKTVSSFSESIGKWQFENHKELKPEQMNILIRSKLLDQVHWEKSNGETLTGFPDDFRDKDPKTIYVTVPGPQALQNPDDPNASQLKDVKIYLDQLINLPQEYFEVIGEKMKQQGKSITWTSFAEILINMRRPQSEAHAKEIADLISKTLPETGLRKEEVIEKITADFKESILKDKHEQDSLPVASVSKKITGNGMARLELEEIKNLWLHVPRLAVESQTGDHILYRPGSFPLNVTNVLEKAAGLPLEELEKNKEKFINRYEKPYRPDLERLVDGLIRRRRGGLTPELVAKQGNWNVGHVSFESKGETLESFAEVTASAPFEFEVADRQINNVMGALGETLSGLNPKMVSANGGKGLFGLNRKKVQTMVDAAKLLKVEGLNLDVDDVMRNTVDQVKLVEWYLFKSIWPRYDKTNNQMAFAISEFLYGKDLIDEAKLRALENDGEGMDTKYEIVKKYLKLNEKIKLKKFFQVLKEQS